MSEKENSVALYNCKPLVTGNRIVKPACLKKETNMCVKTLYHQGADIYQHPTVPTHCGCASFQWETATKVQKEALETHHWRCSVEQLQKDDIRCIQSLNSQTQEAARSRVCVSVILAKCLFTCAFLHHYLSVLTVSALCVCRYVERKNFLERVDQRQFELEKSVRLSNMKRWQEEREQTYSLIKTQTVQYIHTHGAYTLGFPCHIGVIFFRSKACSSPKQKLDCLHNRMYTCHILFSLFRSPFVQYCMSTFIRAFLTWKRNSSRCFSSLGFLLAQAWILPLFKTIIICEIFFQTMKVL